MYVHRHLIDDDLELARAVDVMAREAVTLELRCEGVAEHVRGMHDRTQRDRGGNACITRTIGPVAREAFRLRCLEPVRQRGVGPALGLHGVLRFPSERIVAGPARSGRGRPNNRGAAQPPAPSRWRYPL